MPEYLTITEVSELIRTPIGTLYAWRFNREGPPSLKVGRRLLYNREHLIAWVESRVTA